MRTGADRSAELLEVFRLRSEERLRKECTHEVAAAHDAAPLGPHDDRTQRVLRALRSLPVSGKHIIFSEGPDGPWRVSKIALGMPGNLLLTEQSFGNYEDAMRYIFTARAATLQQN
ncbi:MULTISPECIES: hypothetical protein [Streptomyces]|uniref:N,N-dimethylformamidase alpha subunit domain-containing protein n=1 Tax=Streptomyces ureilyticus TaxID=1775131 RepID=A0ABX0DUA3_9ACTN|nr:hypothetical protein [Streptomyces ureilyticus]NGO45471.1 hypothetical protein [Streptomyces ureilyticus]WSZ19139.1 hypothetical protein OH837_40430 [Streptomyces canus]WSZ29488.1 hypothetical protein OG806_08635 [Streptomyces sp. NBC_00882]WSZ63649.1 hypothetical protein OH824_47575 [Streptomyces canus]